MPFVSGSSGTITTSLTLDPTSEDATNTPLELVEGDDIGLIAHSYPVPPVDLQKVSSVDSDGDLVASSRYGNRTISLTVDCASYNALQALEAKVGKIAQNGGTLKRVLPWGEEIVFDLLANPGYEPGFEQQFFSGVTTVP